MYIYIYVYIDLKYFYLQHRVLLCMGVVFSVYFARRGKRRKTPRKEALFILSFTFRGKQLHDHVSQLKVVRIRGRLLQRSIFICFSCFFQSIGLVCANF